MTDRFHPGDILQFDEPGLPPYPMLVIAVDNDRGVIRCEWTAGPLDGSPFYLCV
jgi:hypothetical protein